MSRAFVKEDQILPDAVVHASYRTYRGLARHSMEPKVVFSSEWLFEVLAWACKRPNGYYQIRDANGVLLAVVDAAMVQRLNHEAR